MESSPKEQHAAGSKSNLNIDDTTYHFGDDLPVIKKFYLTASRGNGVNGGGRSYMKDTIVGFRNLFRGENRSKRPNDIVIASSDESLDRNEEMNVNHSTEMQQAHQSGEMKYDFNEVEDRFQNSTKDDFIMMNKRITNKSIMKSSQDSKKKEVSYRCIIIYFYFDRS